MNPPKNLLFIVLILTVFGISFAQEKEKSEAGKLLLKPDVYKIGNKPYKADHGTLTVPENRNKKGSRLITLPVLRIHATGKNKAEPILFLSGPSASREARSHRYLENEKWLLEHHDIFLVGYRGVFGPVLLDCPEVKEAMKVEKNPLSTKNLEKLTKAYGDCFKRLQTEGVDIDGYTMVEMIDDMEDARKALGYKKISLRGWSYGTRLAYIYGLRYTESIHRTVLVGTVAPGRFLNLEPAVIDAKLEHYASLWKKDPACTTRTPDLIKTMRAVLETLPRQWYHYRIDPDKVKFMTFAVCSTRSSAAMVFDAYVAAEKGDYSGLAYLSFIYDRQVHNAEFLGDRPSKYGSAEFDPEKDYLAELEPPGSIIGSPIAKRLNAAMQDSAWPIKPLPKKYRQPQYSDVETLVISDGGGTGNLFHQHGSQDENRWKPLL